MGYTICAVRRVPPVALGRAFCAAFGRGRPIGGRAPLQRSFRETVDGLLLAEFGVPLPAALDWLVAAACRRRVPAREVAHFLGQLFGLEPLTRPGPGRY